MQAYILVSKWTTYRNSVSIWMHWTPEKCPQLRLQTCKAHFHSTQLDCLSHLTWLVKSYPSLLMGNMEGQKTKYNGPTHPNFFPLEQQILNSKMTRQSRLKRVPKTEAVQSCWSEGEKLVCMCMSGLQITYWQSYQEEREEGTTKWKDCQRNIPPFPFSGYVSYCKIVQVKKGKRTTL